MKIRRILYADDVIIICTTRNIKYAQEIINKYFKKIENYFTEWKLKLNIDKCESISFIGHYKDLQRNIRKMAKDIKFNISGKILEHKKSIKYLGITFTSNLQFNTHVKSILMKVNTAIDQLKNIFRNKFVNKPVKILGYKQLIRPIILYATPIWPIKNVLSSAQMEKLRLKERWCFRHCLKMFRNPITNKYYNSKILYDNANINRIDREMIKKNKICTKM